MIFITEDSAGFVSVHETTTKEIAIQAHLLHYGLLHGNIKAEITTDENIVVCHSSECDEYIELLEYEDDKMECHNIDEVRSNIDIIDEEIIKSIALRGKYVKQAAKFKKNTDDVKAPDRVGEVIVKVKDHALEYGLDPEIAEKVYRVMINCFIEEELKMVEGGTN